MNPQQEAAAILNHYMAQLARACDLKWTPRNAADIERAVALLGQGEPAPLDEVPPYRPIHSERQTVVLDRDNYGDPQFGRWRAQRAVQDDETERLLRREGGRG